MQDKEGTASGTRIAVELNSVKGFFFDTINTLSAPVDKRILQDALDQCAFYNDLLSKTVPGSDVHRINNAAGKPVQISAHTARIIEVALDIGRQSKGALNIALEPLIRLWDVRAQNPRVPKESEIQEAMRGSDLSLIELDGQTIRVPEDMSVDLGGIAKGYIADRIADYLRSRGVNSALLNLGGNVATVGKRPDGQLWSIGLQSPEGLSGVEYFAVVSSSDNSVVTSGVYERGFDLDGVRYHHILDPRSGYPVSNGVVSVTAIGSESLMADALTTAMFVLGKNAGEQLAARYGYQCVFRMADGSISYTDGLSIKLLA